jgi:hypothetical protein
MGPANSPFLPPIDRQQITVAALLNMFIAWESFLEASLVELMTGGLRQSMDERRPDTSRCPA